MVLSMYIELKWYLIFWYKVFLIECNYSRRILEYFEMKLCYSRCYK